MFIGKPGVKLDISAVDVCVCVGTLLIGLNPLNSREWAKEQPPCPPPPVRCARPAQQHNSASTFLI